MRSDLSSDAFPHATGQMRGQSAALLCFACLLLPWLNPYAAGPSSWVGPWLFSAFCAALAFGIAPRGSPQPVIPAALTALAGWTILRSGWSPETLALAAACLLVWMMAGLAGGAASRPELVRAVACSWLAAALLSTAAGLLQYFGFAERLAPWVNMAPLGEAFANLRQRNQFASLTAIGMATLFWWPQDRLGRRPALAAIVWLAIGNASTTSRTGLVQLLALGALAWFWPGARKQRLQLWLAALAAYLVAAFTLPWLLEAISGLPASHIWSRVTGIDPCGSRIVLWSNVLHLIAQRPWLGWGWGELDFAHYMTLYSGPRFCDILDNAHNLPLHIAVELGVPAAFIMCAGALWALVRAAPWRESSPPRQMAWSVLLVLALHSLLEYPLWYGPFQIALGLSLGLLWPGPLRPDSSHAAVRGLAGAVVAAAGLAGSGYAALDYHRASQIYLPPERRAAAWRDDPLAAARGSWLFRSQVRFAELTLAPVTRSNAAASLESAAALLHYSPEPRVIETLIDSEMLLRRDSDLPLQLARFRAAFPEAYATWIRERGHVPHPPDGSAPR